MADDLDAVLARIRSCRVCAEIPSGRPLPHQPRPIIGAAVTARLAVCGQAPGTRVHACGVPFLDPSGERLRNWMGVTQDEFYDVTRVAIVPMGFCFPGLDAHGSDLPPRRECAPLWRARVLGGLPHLQLVLLVGSYAMRWHLPQARKATMTATVHAWRDLWPGGNAPRLFPLPHPSWRNNAWVKRNPWFAAGPATRFARLCPPSARGMPLRPNPATRAISDQTRSQS